MDQKDSAARGSVLEAVALAQVKAGDRAGARTTLQELRQMVDRLPPQHLPAPQAIVPVLRVANATRLRSATVAVQAQLGDFEGALQTASALDSPNEKTKALLKIGTAQIEAGKLADARETLFRAACAAEDTKPGTETDGPTGRSRPSEHVLGTTMRLIAEQQAKAGDIKQALRTVENLPANRPDAIARSERDIALAGIVRAQAQAGDVKGGLETLARIQNDEDKAFVLEHLVQAQVRAGDERGALALAARQLSPLLKAHALLAVASGKANQKTTKE